MVIREVLARSVLSESKVYDYTVNAYAGCAHSCSYCYARFMKRFTGHKEPWGEFVDVKINAPDLLAVEIRKKRPGTIWVSGVCDPYQPLEAKYELTKACIGIITGSGWPLVVQTRSPLVVRDLDILASSPEVEVGLSITTADDRVRRLFEPKAPPIAGRVEALQRLHAAGIRTFAMIAPLLPGAEELPGLLAGKVRPRPDRSHELRIRLLGLSQARFGGLSNRRVLRGHRPRTSLGVREGRCSLPDRLLAESGGRRRLPAVLVVRRARCR